MIYILGFVVFVLIVYVLTAVNYYSHKLAELKKKLIEMNGMYIQQTDQINYMTMDITQFKEDLTAMTMGKITNEVDNRLRAILIEKDRLETRHAELLQKYNALQKEISLRDFMDSVSGEAKMLPLPEPLELGEDLNTEDGE